MADKSKKPRKIKDLKARLGRTIAPNTQKAGGVPAPAVGGAKKGVVPPPAGAGPVKPPVGIGGAPSPGGLPGFGPQVAPPPFARKKQQEEADPFTTPPPPDPSQLHIVVDEPTGVSAADKRGRMMTIVMLAIGIPAGIVGGTMFGSVIRGDELQALASADAADIAGAVEQAAPTVSEAQQLMNRAASAAEGDSGSVDYAAIEGLQQLEKPLDAGSFARKRYGAIDATTVDRIFAYENNVGQLWERFSRLANRTLPDARRTAIDAAAADPELAAPTGCVPGVQTVGEDEEAQELWTCGLVFVAPSEQEGKTEVRSRLQTPRQYPKDPLSSLPENFAESPGNYVLHLEANSFALPNEFALYAQEVAALKELLDETVELQNQIRGQLGGG